MNFSPLLVQYATVAGHFPGVIAAAVKAKSKKAEIQKEELQAALLHPDLRIRHRVEAHLQLVLPSRNPSRLKLRKGAREEGKEKANRSRDPREGNSSAYHSTEDSDKRGDHCNCEDQLNSDGEPIPVGPEILQKHDEAVKRFNENKAQAKAKSAPKGGVGISASMIVLEPDEEESKISAHAVKVPVSDECYAMVDYCPPTP